ncbi:MAG: EAL domain-containing protein [Solirubrobacteraceae bacterium]
MTALAASGAAALLAWRVGFDVDTGARFWLLSFFVLAAELLPIPVPRRHGIDKVTISAAFAFALLLDTGVLPACVVYAASLAIADLYVRTAPAKVLFNAAQYVLSLAGAGAVLIIAGHGPPVALHTAAVPAILLAGLVCLMINQVLAGTGAALLAGLPVLGYLGEDVAFQGWTAGCTVALAPGVVALANASLALIPFAFVPMLAIYFGGRQAAISAHRAMHDSLTELPNRALLHLTLTASLQTAERTHGGVAVMIVDLDDFKAINSTLGHQFGDRVLQLVATRLVSALARDELLARLGGDEFAAIVEGVEDGAGALRCAERWLEALERPFEVDSMMLQIGGSVGVAFAAPGETADELLRHADVALYIAKAERSTCALYSPEHDQYSIDQLALAAQLRHGIARGELVVHYQPKLPLGDRGERGVEALVRWNHPQLGTIGPDAFVPLAEQTGLIKALTESVFETALRQCEAWRASRLDVRFSVNLSTRSLLDQDLPAMIRDLLKRFTVPPASLQLEITESRFLADVDRARTVLDELRAMGVTFAIDDFGTGFSSLSQLQQLPFDEIKIDRSFVMRMESDRDDAVLVRSIIELARNLGLHVTAEGVETASVQRALRDLGCDFAQGFHVGRPVPADECRRLLEVGATAVDERQRSPTSVSGGAPSNGPGTPESSAT